MVDTGAFNIFNGIPKWEIYGIIGFVALVAIGAVTWFIRSRRSQRDPNEPLSTVDEFDKTGYVHVHEVEREAEGASFLWFERSNGDIDHKQIGQPFTFHMEDNSVERHHLNARGSYRCIDPKALFDGFTYSLKELNRLASLTEQHIKTLRTGSMTNDKASKHIRMFILLFLLAGMIGLGIAAGTVHH